MSRTDVWDDLRPRFVKMFARVHWALMVERTEVPYTTLYRLARGETRCPHPRTLRDIRAALALWEADGSPSCVGGRADRDALANANERG